MTDATLTDRAYRGLRQKLASGELRAGQRIVNRTIAKELNVSQTPLREAVNRLASEGIIEYVPGAGAYVRKVDLQELLQLYDLREHVEPFAAGLAAKNAHEAELLEMQSICQDWGRLCHEIRDGGLGTATAEQMARWNDGEEQFHVLLLSASRNRWLNMIARNLRLLAVAFAVQRNAPQLLSMHAAAITWRDHVRILRALQRRDSTTAQGLLRQHIAAGRAYVVRTLAGQLR